VATKVTKSVGATGRDYSTLALAIAALPANLVTADQQWTFELYADAEFVSTSAYLLSGITTDATRYVEIAAAAGQSFQDNANVRTNALRYNTANGVALRQTSNYVTMFDVRIDYLRMSRLQIYQQGGAGAVLSNNSIDVTNATIADLIVETENVGGAFAAIQTATSTLTNVLCYLRGNTGQGAFGRYNGGNTYYHCAAILDSNDSASGMGFRSNYATSTYYNCASFGFSTAAGNADSASRNCATDLASFGGGSGHVTSVSFSSSTPWTNAASGGSQDLSAVASASLAAAGLDTTATAPMDITGALRPATPTIGHWELSPASSSPSIASVTPSTFADGTTGIVIAGSNL
jgi:hypothetical protein